MNNPIDLAKNTYVDINIFDEENKKKQKELDQLPSSCVESARRLEDQRSYYTKYDVFPDSVIDLLIKTLINKNDEGLIGRIQNDDEKVMDLVTKYFNCG